MRHHEPAAVGRDQQAERPRAGVGRPRAARAMAVVPGGVVERALVGVRLDHRAVGARRRHRRGQHRPPEPRGRDVDLGDRLRADDRRVQRAPVRRQHEVVRQHADLDPRLDRAGVSVDREDRRRAGLADEDPVVRSGHRRIGGRTCVDRRRIRQAVAAAAGDQRCEHRDAAEPARGAAGVAVAVAVAGRSRRCEVIGGTHAVSETAVAICRTAIARRPESPRAPPPASLSCRRRRCRRRR